MHVDYIPCRVQALFCICESSHHIFELLVLTHQEGGYVLDVDSSASMNAIRKDMGDITYHAFLDRVCIPGPFGHSVEFNDLFFRLDNPVCESALPSSIRHVWHSEKHKL